MSKKKNSITKTKKKPGLAPGSIVYHGNARTANVKITLIQYNETEFFEQEFVQLEECLAACNPTMTKWINVDGIHNVELIEAIGKAFNIHALTLEDIASTAQRPKFEDYDSYLVAMMKMIYYTDELLSEQLSILLLQDTVITFQEVENKDVFDIIRNRIRHAKGRVRKMKADYLAYVLIDAVVDFYFNVIEKLGDKIELIEDELIQNPTKNTIHKLHAMKREMIFLRKAIWPMRELVNNMERSESTLILPSTDIYLRDVYDHVIRTIDTVETYRDLLSGMMDIYLSSVSNKMNEIMKVLTIITTIFVPVTFIAGVYGMNFENMPELHSQYGYAITWLVMLTSIISLLFYFRKKKWL